MNPSELVSQLIEPKEHLDTNKYSYKSVLLAALHWPTDGWAPQAMDWIESGVEIDSEIAITLEEFSSNKHYSQANRHRAFALAKRWLKKQSTT
ncbi:hypothetical protein J8Z24_17665 [Pseudoalteromonas sp. SCSIO 43201]|uniref:hypothetical protein n=1 Tax=Pseudoalteromonas sp. SCSIO 43201 TaxID=2822842 RepID=UPI002074E14C|nr:hypothetical protein [Pseudoalteromonas sp. SCSIO 43201]USD30799.1 hypothetical protein J8Z24_17655 [Pseudoalteromonas sp. SCSIO 43201]USD30801.1 hypothetical protein J8Z24_17665 [Pseudoalteromonas sp. SCSIO 43201]